MGLNRHTGPSNLLAYIRSDNTDLGAGGKKLLELGSRDCPPAYEQDGAA